MTAAWRTRAALHLVASRAAKRFSPHLELVEEVPRGKVLLAINPADADTLESLVPGKMSLKELLTQASVASTTVEMAAKAGAVTHSLATSGLEKTATVLVDNLKLKEDLTKSMYLMVSEIHKTVVHRGEAPPATGEKTGPPSSDAAGKGGAAATGAAAAPKNGGGSNTKEGGSNKDGKWGSNGSGSGSGNGNGKGDGGNGIGNGSNGGGDRRHDQFD